MERFTKEIAPLALNGPPTVTGLGSGRPKVEEIVAYWPALIPEDRSVARDFGAGDLMARVKLVRIAHARSGDKGDTANVGLIALKPEYLSAAASRQVTAERVKKHFTGICLGAVERFELPNLGALNFLLHESLDGGGTLSLKADAQGKTYSAALLRMEIDVPDDLLSKDSVQR